jgi:hypothetical protein
VDVALFALEVIAIVNLYPLFTRHFPAKNLGKPQKIILPAMGSRPAVTAASHALAAAFFLLR